MRLDKGFSENKKNRMMFIGVIAILLIGFGIFFFSYFKVKNVEIMESNYYTEGEIREMVLDGQPFANNSVLAPLFLSKKHVDNIPFVNGYSVTALNKNTICVSLRETVPVGCVPYLDFYIYFNNEGVFTESSRERDPKIPFFDGVELDYVIQGKELPIAGKTIFNTAVAVAGIFRKNDLTAENIEFDSAGNVSMIYGDIRVELGKDQYLEDKMARVLAILPKLEGEKGILHVESVSDKSKVITFERDKEVMEITAANWPGGYDEDGEYTGDGEYDERGRYVGNRPMTEYDYALAAWPGGYDDDGDYTGWGLKDVYGEFVGEPPTPESIEAQGDWHGGYDESGRYITTGQFDREGYYVGPDPRTIKEADSDETEDNEEAESEDYKEEEQDSESEKSDE